MGLTQHRQLASAALPIAGLPDAQIGIWGGTDESDLHVVIESGTATPADVTLVRVHSACMTGDVFGSLRCDCGEQLAEATRLISQAPHGVIVYPLSHEGRGIGLANKVRAYALQDTGFDTFAANRHLGFADDHRSFEGAADILLALGLRRIILLTRNPQKAQAMVSSGLEVIECRSLDVIASPYNQQYLDTKWKAFDEVAPSPTSATWSLPPIL
jgi:GTP cyclohydrolase II